MTLIGMSIVKCTVAVIPCYCLNVTIYAETWLLVGSFCSLFRISHFGNSPSTNVTRAVYFIASESLPWLSFSLQPKIQAKWPEMNPRLPKISLAENRWNEAPNHIFLQSFGSCERVYPCRLRGSKDRD
jgi:hypothetical protein